MNDLDETEDYASFQASFSESDFDPRLLPDREPLCVTNYVPIRSLGQGAFGEAILYRKTADNSLVVWKEVDLSRMDAAQRTSALGEVEILSSLPRHPNIVQYFTHFQSYPPDDPVLLIEMEYANGGNLMHYISSAGSLLDQQVVEWLFFQVMSAVAHIHKIPILHRDIKTLNIFLTRSAALVKLGDFGISKKLDSCAQLSETVVGTPYYMSPELMQGLPYNQKSDIWACGCVLVELLTLQKSFDATNALRLANDVVHGKFQFEINEKKYTAGVKELVHQMLQPKPEDRPEATDVLHGGVFGSKYETLEKRVLRQDEVTSFSSLNKFSSQNSDFSKSAKSFSGGAFAFTGSGISIPIGPTVTSQTSELFVWGGGRSHPIRIEEEFSKKGNCAIRVAAGSNHLAAITLERELYTWNPSGVSHERNVGQLGVGGFESQRQPKRVDSLCETVPVLEAACGTEFTLILTADMQLYGCGSLESGCLDCAEGYFDDDDDDLGGGSADSDCICTPTLLNTSINTQVKSIACGANHCLALTVQGEVFSWGSGEFGKTGHGNENDVSEPTGVIFPGNVNVISMAGGCESSIFISEDNTVYSCGSNEFNKIAQNAPQLTGVKTSKKLCFDVQCVLRPSLARTLKGLKASFADCGDDHSAIVDIHGRIILFGSNKRGQLGTSDSNPVSGCHVMSGTFAGKKCRLLSCGDYFTVAITTENEVFAWGYAADGRLGFSAERVDFSSTNRNWQSQLVVNRPRPIFGSLHSVTALASNSWHTILVAERVQSVKMINADCQSSSAGGIASYNFSSSSSELSSDIPDSIRAVADYNESGDSNKTSNFSAQINEASMSHLRENPGQTNPENSWVPDWLKEELENAECIPLCKESKKRCETSGRTEMASIVDNCSPSVRNLRRIEEGCENCSHLVEELKLLKCQNARLTDLVAEQQIQINELQTLLDRHC